MSNLIASFFPPNLDPQWLRALLPAILDTLGLTLGAMTLALAIGLPLGLVVGLRMPGSSLLRGLLPAARAIPDLTLAILCVIVFGIGTGAGLIALGLYYAAVIGKVYGDLLRTAPAGPLDTMRSTGASPLQLGFWSLIPLRSRDLLSFGTCEFECLLRASTVVGAVGAGGLGGELVGSLAALDFPRVTTLLAILVALVALSDRIGVWLRSHPSGLWLLLPVGVMAIEQHLPQLFAGRHAMHVVAEMFPPQLSARQWSAVPGLLWETVAMAIAGTLGAAIAALLLAPLMARHLAPAWLGIPLRRVMEVLRAIPEVVFGLVLIAVVGIGPTAGALALGLHSAGCLARLYAEALENAPRAPQLALAATGAGSLAVAGWGTVPLAVGPLAVHTLFRFEWNLRMATVLGLIGAGGIGQALYESQQLFFYDRMMAYLLVTAALVLSVDLASDALRRRFGLSVVA